jgi:hypothetical protein
VICVAIGDQRVLAAELQHGAPANIKNSPSPRIQSARCR